MGINLDKMRSKLDRVEGRASRASEIFWKPQDGEQTIRILPTEDGAPRRILGKMIHLTILFAVFLIRELLILLRWLRILWLASVSFRLL